MNDPSETLKTLSDARQLHEQATAEWRSCVDRVHRLVRQARAAGISVTEIADASKLSRQTVYEICRAST